MMPSRNRPWAPLLAGGLILAATCWSVAAGQVLDAGENAGGNTDNEAEYYEADVIDAGDPGDAGRPAATGQPRSIQLDSGTVMPLPELGAAPLSSERAGDDRNEMPDADAGHSERAPPSVVDIETLDLAGPAAVGLLTEDGGGFAPTLWDGSRIEAITPLLTAAPGTGGSPAMRTLFKRLLLTEANPPAAERRDRRQADAEFLMARLNRLAAMGDLESLNGMLSRLDPGQDSVALAELRTSVHLLTENYAAACAAAQRPSASGTDVERLRLIAVCRSMEDDIPGTNLALELVRDQGGDDPVFMALTLARLRGVSASEIDLPPVEAPTPLTLAQARLVGLPLSEAALVDASPLVLARLAALPGLDPAVRVRAARAVARRGGFEADRLAQIYAAITFSTEEIENVLVLIDDMEPALGDALLYQAALGAPDVRRQSQILQLGFQRARRDGVAPLYAEVSASAVAAVRPAPEIMDTAADVVRLLLLAGRQDVAQDWYAYLGEEAEAGSNRAAGYLVDLWPLIMLGAPLADMAYVPQALELWWRSREMVDDPDRDSKARLLYALLEAEGHSVPPYLRAAVSSSAEGTPDRNGSLVQGLERAAAEGRVGETALITIVVLGEDGPAAADPDVVVAATRALVAIGLESDARRLTIEALTGRGL